MIIHRPLLSHRTLRTVLSTPTPEQELLRPAVFIVAMAKPKTSDRIPNCLLVLIKSLLRPRRNRSKKSLLHNKWSYNFLLIVNK